LWRIGGFIKQKEAMRVFVLGAGASFHAGYPLAAEMGKRLAAWIETFPRGHQYRSCLDQIADLYGTLDNFETIFADLMTCRPGSKAASLGVAWPYVLGDLKEAIREQFDAIRSAPAPLYEALARVARPGDLIITFNYDLAIDRSLRAAGLWDVKTGYGFSIESAGTSSPVEVLKLHGSTNWRALLFGGRTGFFAGGGNSLGSRPVLFFRPDLEYLGYADFIDPECLRLDTAASLPSMIMPALPKHFYFETAFGQEWKSFWDHLWHRAAGAIANADELVVIGYSLPVADERARTMLLDSGNKSVRLSIYCGNATARLEQEFRENGFNGIENCGSTFDDFLSSEASKNATAMSAPNLPATAANGFRSVLARLNALTGKQGLLNIRYAGEVGFTFLSVVDPPPDLPADSDGDAIQNAITRSRFLVRFDEGTLIDGSNTRTISGRDISLIRGRY
jgi:hypothetical protein